MKDRNLLLQAINRPFNYAVVDEVDSLLIDDCRNPMIISGLRDSSSDRFNVAREVCLVFMSFTLAVLSLSFCIQIRCDYVAAASLSCSICTTCCYTCHC